MDVLIKQLEMYRAMAFIFYKRLSVEERIDALTEAAIEIKMDVLDEDINQD